MSTQSSNENIYDKVYAEKKELVFLTALKHVKYDEDVAEEIMQEVFLSLYNHKEKLDSEYLTGWLMLTAEHKAKTYMRKYKKEYTDENIELTMDLHVSGESVEEIVLEKERNRECAMLGREIFDGLYKVNPRWYEIISMVSCLDKSRQDMADELGVSLGVFQSVLCRARKWINKNFSDEKDEIL